MLGNAIALIGIAALFGIEAYKAKDHVPRRVLGTIAVVTAICALGIGPIVGKTPAVGTFLSGVFEQPLSWFVLFIALFLVLRSFWTEPTARVTLNLSDKGEALDLEARLNEFFATTLRAEFATHAQMHEYDERLVLLADQVKSAQGSAQFAFDFAQNESSRLDERVGEIAEGALELERKWNDWTCHHINSNEQRFEGIDAGFMAILHRERLHINAGMIEEDAKLLLRIRDGDKVENWGAWETQRVKWLSIIDRWLEIAEIYRVGCRDRILRVEPEQLHGEWPESEGSFPNIDAMMAYRKVGVILGQFRAERQFAEEAITIAAHHSPSKKSPLSKLASFT